MPREVAQDKSLARVEAASKKASTRGSGMAGGSLKGVNFTPGEREIYKRKK